MKERAHNSRSYSGRQTHPGDARKRSGTLLSGLLLGIPRFRPRHAALILVALALAITGFAALLAAPDRATVTAAASDGHNSPVAGWTEPDHPGANIADYDADYGLRYRIGGGSGEFTDAEYAGDQTSATATGLDTNTTYEAELASRPTDEVTISVRNPDTVAAGAVEDGGPDQAVLLIPVASGGGYTNPTGGTARVAAQAVQTTLWSATLTVGKHSDNEWYGFGTDSSGTYGMIDPASFMTGGTTYNIRSLISSQDISGQALFIRVLNSPGFRNVMTLTVGGRDFEGSAATTSSGNTGFSWPTNPAFTWAVGDTVSVSLKATLPDAPTNVSAEAGRGRGRPFLG